MGSPGDLIKTQLLTQETGSGWRNCMSSKLPGDADEAWSKDHTVSSQKLSVQMTVCILRSRNGSHIRVSICLCARCCAKCFLSSSSCTLHTSTARWAFLSLPSPWQARKWKLREVNLCSACAICKRCYYYLPSLPGDLK